ncbi:D-2-hydroxyacid dehydrogenase family protein, partial [Myxococcota bacterium]|nr:D-2-hydroxyacid dehydrogenase family protein [Myxococcota bacterium]
ARLADFDAIVAMRERTPFPGALLARLPRLKLLVATGMFHQTIDFETAKARGIVVCGTENGPGLATTVEHIWAMILGLARRLHDEDAAMRAGGWQVSLPPLLAGKTLGILGLGNLGRAIVPLARAFGMRAVAWSRNLTDEAAEAASVERLDYEDFFAESDVLTVQLKLSPRSIGYVGASEFARMKSTALFVNTSRGPVVDEAALIEALRAGRIAGAALDVFDREPLPVDHPFRSLPNTLLTPHMGYVSRETYRVLYTTAIEALVAFRAGRPIRRLG